MTPVLVADRPTGAEARAPIYLDNQCSTPLDPRVLEAMLPYFREHFGNPGNESHPFGRIAAEAVEEARSEVARLIGAEPRELIFTSGATESNNLALKGVARFVRAYPEESPERNHIVTVATEHKSALESCRALAADGFRVTVLPVEANGLVALSRLADAVTEKTLIVSVMAAHNEIGVIEPIAEIAALCRSRGALFHSDAAQAFGKIPIDVEALGIDLLSISAHKIYGPKGVGALYVRRRPRVRLLPLFDGGGEERGLRPGTLPAPLCIGLGRAAAIARAEMAEEGERVKSLRERMLSALLSRVPGLELNGDAQRRLPGNLNLSVPGIGAAELIAACPEIAVSTGAACDSAAVEPSYVLRALGRSDEEAGSAVRIGLGRFTTAEEVDFAALALAAAVERLQSAKRSPK